MQAWWGSLVDWLKANPTGGTLVAASVTLIVFLLTRIAEILVQALDKRSTRKRIVIGVFQEVRKNLRTIQDFLDRNPYPGDLRAKVHADSTFRPLMIIDETTQFYDAIAASLPEIKSDCLRALSLFYDAIRTEHAVAKAFESSAFPTLSSEGRVGTVDDLWKSLRNAEREGWKALYELELAYPRRWFRDFRSE